MLKITHHPNDTLIQQFANGELNDTVALLVAAHIELCPHCQQRQHHYEQQLSQQWLTQPPTTEAPNCALEQMLQQLQTQLPTAATHPKATMADTETTLTLQQQQFELPQVLAKQLHRLTPWAPHLGQLHQARLSLGQQSLQFIHMAPNSKVPAHTHKGRELTLVLHGGFADEQGHYLQGDFIERDQQHQHQPHTDANEDCLVISALDAPLHFTSGLARMLNPLSNLFFKP